MDMIQKIHTYQFMDIFLKGDYDDKLEWPFTGTSVVTLLNQNVNTDHIQRHIYFKVTKLNSGDKLCHKMKNEDLVLKICIIDSLYFKVCYYEHRRPWLTPEYMNRTISLMKKCFIVFEMTHVTIIFLFLIVN